MKHIEETYQDIIARSETELRQVRQRIYYISLLRVVLFAVAIIDTFAFWSDGWEALLPLAALPFLLFLWLVKRHNRWFRRKDYLKEKIRINEQELRALEYDFADFDNGEEFVDPAHLYTFDLDVFGPHSLFQYINRTATPAGKQHLAQWLDAHLEEKTAIEQRQEAIRELAPELEFRQQFRLLGLLYKGVPTDIAEIRAWAESPATYHGNPWLRFLPTAVLAINVIGIGAACLGWWPASLAGVVFGLCLVSSFAFTGRITKLQIAYGKKLKLLSTYADQILLTEQKEMRSPALQALKAELTSHGQTASQAVRRLSELMNSLDQRNNLLMLTILNGLMFWELRKMTRIEEWKARHATDLPRWIEAIGELDAYCSIATFAYNHPTYTYPTLTASPFSLQATALGHPLMDRRKCVRNDIHVDGRPSFIIITGANMAGKSTYLRTVGVNYLLACVGAPVWADQMELYPARLVTSLRTSDSLTDNESYFFAELKRLKLIIDKLEAGEELFIILDEILKGTNSMDKQKGSLALIRQFMTLNANGIIATHDLLLGTLAEAYPQNIRNHCFEADITDNELTFSYRMRDGVAQNMNACFLMKKMGIAIAE
ncbi:MAG: hypothetical protein LBN24_09785 [Mediterranea sp.]|jgi:DNA mismatch repair ATPase MutS|nr:hypothetical protein [Mediterranea sp.]